MPQILVEALAKTYRVAERAPGLTGALRGLVRRRWREIHALADVSFSLEGGELLAFIGPNGAGKSTTVKILSGILRPTSGRVEVGGLVPYEDRVRHVARIGVVFGQRSQLWWQQFGEKFRRKTGASMVLDMSEDEELVGLFAVKLDTVLGEIGRHLASIRIDVDRVGIDAEAGR